MEEWGRAIGEDRAQHEHFCSSFTSKRTPGRCCGKERLPKTKSLMRSQKTRRANRSRGGVTLRVQPVCRNTWPWYVTVNTQRHPLGLTLKSQWGRRGNTNAARLVLATVPGTLFAQRGCGNPSGPSVAHFIVVGLISAIVPVRTGRRCCGAIFHNLFIMHITTHLSLATPMTTRLGRCGATITLFSQGTGTRKKTMKEGKENTWLKGIRTKSE